MLIFHLQYKQDKSIKRSNKTIKMSLFRAQVQYAYCIQRKFYAQSDYQNSISKQPYYIVTPFHLGKYSSLLEKYQLLFGNIDIKIDKKLQLTPLFKFILRCQVAFDMATFPDGISGYFQSLKVQLKSSKSTKLQKQRISLLVSFIDKINEQEPLKKIEKIINQLNYQMKDVIRFPRYKRIMAYDKIVLQYTALCLQEFKEIQRDDYQTIFGNKQILTPEILIGQAKKIQLLRKPVIYKKLKIFDKTYRSFYGSHIMSDGSSKNNFVVKLNKLFRQNEPIVQTIQTMISMRSDGINYQSQSYDIILRLWKQFKRYNSQIKNYYKVQRNQFYYQISPENVVFNQLSLGIKLHYNPYFYQALGLNKKPCTIMTRLAFFPTPKQFNYYRSLPQVQNQCIKRMIEDPYFGNKDFIDQKSQVKVSQQWQNQINESFPIRQQQSIYKFILTCYFILNSKQYGRVQQVLTYPQRQQHFLRELQILKKQLKNNFSTLQNYIGISNKRVQKVDFSFEMHNLQQYFAHCQNEQDSLLKSLKYKKIQKFFNLRYGLINELNGIMMQQRFFYRILNVKKYFIIYLIAVDEYLTQLHMTNNIQKDKYDERKQLKQFLNKNLTKKKFVFKKDSINAYDTLGFIYARIQQYCKRDHTTDKQSKYLNTDINGQKMLNFIKDFQKIKSVLTSIENELLKLQEGNHDNKYRQKYTLLLDQSNSLLLQNHLRYKTILKQFINHEIKSSDKPLHKYPQKYKQNIPQQIKQYYNLINIRYYLLIQCYLTINYQYNYLIYQISVLPLFRIIQGKYYNQDRINKQNNKIDQINYKNIAQICKVYNGGQDKNKQQARDNRKNDNNGLKEYLKIDVEKQMLEIKKILEGKKKRKIEEINEDGDGPINNPNIQ